MTKLLKGSIFTLCALMLVACNPDKENTEIIAQIAEKDKEIENLKRQVQEQDKLKGDKKRLEDIELELTKWKNNFGDIEKVKRRLTGYEKERKALGSDIKSLNDELDHLKEEQKRLKLIEEKYLVQCTSLEIRLNGIYDNLKFSSLSEGLIDVKIGMNEVDVYKALGDAISTNYRNTKAGEVMSMEYDGMTVNYVKGMVSSITATRKNADIIRNIRIGDSFSVIDEVFRHEGFTVPLELGTVIEDVYDNNYYDFSKKLYPRMSEYLGRYTIRFDDAYNRRLHFVVRDSLIAEIQLTDEKYMY